MAEPKDTTQIDIINHELDLTNASLSRIVDSIPSLDRPKLIDCSNLLNNDGAPNRHEYESWLSSLKSISGPVLYWFEIVAPSFEEMGDLTLRFAVDNGNRRSSNVNKAYIVRTQLKETTTTTLYVGKVEKDFSKRIKEHLGFAKAGSTHSLQLCFRKEMRLMKLELNYYQFNQNAIGFMAAIERFMARKKRPLLGNHVLE